MSFGPLAITASVVKTGNKEGGLRLNLGQPAYSIFQNPFLVWKKEVSRPVMLQSQPVRAQHGSEALLPPPTPGLIKSPSTSCHVLEKIGGKL